ncbi:GDSL-type esterase/lipase family protein [Paludisphaera rhizosphaerae]|uniref:GDSL-type esterase/lipase family protein n=1 Tax=Paludisphaera rhizosphaerae TaxID=2711216 RepID=UPI0013ED17B4|nr:GDSL-type esterase/lipase family protein [Paludisphaera rhizosphaerae]
MPTATITSPSDASKFIFRSGSDFNSGGGGEIKFNGTDLAIRPYVFSPSGNPANTDPIITVAIDGGEPVDIPIEMLGEYTTVTLASGLTDGPHVAVISYDWSGALDEPCITVSGSAPGFWSLTYLPAGGVSSPLTTFGVWDWQSTGSWNALSGEICGALVGSGDVWLWVQNFSSPTNPLYVSIDGSESALTPTGYTFLPIASNLVAGTHPLTIRNETTGAAWGFNGDSSSAFLRVRSAPGATTPTLAAEVGGRYSPRDASKCEPPLGDFVGAINGESVRELACRSVLTSPTWQALVLKNGAQYLVRDGSTDGSVQTLPTGGTVGWVTLASGLTGTHTLEFRTPVASPPKVYAFRTAEAGQATAPSTFRSKILFVGDSITQAIFAGSTYPDSTKGWAYKVENALPANAANIAVPGYRSDQILTVFNGYCTAYGSATMGKPDLIAAYVGMNDVSQDGESNYPGGSTVTPSAYADYIADIIEQSQATFPGVPILLLNIARVGSDVVGDYNTALAGAIADAGGEEAGVHLLDISELAADSGLFVDGIHPNDAGWTAIAELAQPEIESILGLGADPLSVSLASSSITSSTATVTATPTGGVGTLTYAWTLDGDTVEGETGAVLDLTGLAPLSGYTIAVTVTDSDSPPATAADSIGLTTLAAALTLSLASSAITSTSATITATSTGGTGAKTYSWTLDDEPLSGETAAVLHLPALTPSTEYEVTCTVADSATPTPATTTTSTALTTAAAPSGRVIKTDPYAAIILA